MKQFACLWIKKQGLIHSILALFVVVFIAQLYFVPHAESVAGINRQINFQGKLANPNGTNVTDGSYTLIFKIYQESSGGTALWTETQTVSVADGIFRVALGSSTAFPSNFNFNWDGLYLGIKVNSDSEMTPRIQMSAVPYAFNAEKVAGLTVQDTSGNASTSGILQVANGKTVTFGDAFSTTVGNSLALTTTGPTTLTLPTSGTLSTLAGSEILTNKTVGSTGLTFSGATTDITTVSNEDFVISPGGSGNVGIGTLTPRQFFDILKSGTGTQLRLSNGDNVRFTDFATNQIGNFLIAPQGGSATISGSLQVSSYATVAASLGIGTVTAPLGNGIINVSGNYQVRGTDGVSGTNSCLTTVGGIVTTIAGSCGGSSGANFSYWNQASGAVSVDNPTTDLLVGGSATTSARFAVLNVAPGLTPVASVSAGTAGATYLTADGKLATTVRQNLTIGDTTTTGNVIINPAGNIGIGGTTAVEKLSLTGNATVSGNLTFSGATSAIQNTAFQPLTIGGTTTGNIVLNPNNAAAGGNISPSTTNVTDLGTGVKVWRNIYVNNVIGSTTGIQGYWQRNNGILFPVNQSDDLLIGAVATPSASTTNYFQVFGVGNGATGTTAGDATSSGSLTLGTNRSAPFIQAARNNALTLGGNTTGDIFLMPRNGIGRVGINTTSPLAALDVRGSINTIPTASISANTTHATLALDNSNANGYLLVASNSGSPRFVVMSSGNVGINKSIPTEFLDVIGNVNVAGGVYKSGGIAGVSGSNSCLTSTGGLVTTIAGTCAGGSGGPFSEITSNGAIIQNNTTEDLLLGGTATTSAKFAVLNLAGGTPTATTAGNFIVMPWTNGASQVGGNVGIGTTAPTDKLVIAGGSLVLSSSTNQGIQGGGLTDCSTTGNRLTWNSTTNQFGCATDKPYIAVRKSIDETVTSLTTPQDDDELKFNVGANETWTAQFVIQQNSGTVPDFKFAVTAPSGATCDVSVHDVFSNTNNKSNLACGVSQAVTGSAADQITIVYATVVNSGTAGTVTLQWSQNTSDPGNTSVLAGSTVVATNISGANLINMSPVPDWTVTGGTIFPRLATSMDLLIGGNSTASAKFAFINVSNGTPIASVSGNIVLGTGDTTMRTIGTTRQNALQIGDTNTGSLLFAPAGSVSMVVGSNGNVGIGTTSPLAGLDLRYSIGTIPVASISGRTSFAGLAVDNAGTGDIFVASSSGFNRFVISSAGNVGIGKAIPTERLEINGNINVNGGVYKTNGTLGVTGSNSCVSSTNGLVTTIAGSCAGGGGGSNWNIVNGAIFPNYASTVDFLIGGSSTSSAKFAFVNVSNGAEPTASIAGSITLRNGVGQINRLNGGSIDFRTSAGGDSGLLSRFTIANNGNVGVGTSSATAKLDVVGDIKIEAKPNSDPATITNWTKVSNAVPGTLVTGGTSGIASISAAAVYNGSLYVGTSKFGAAEVYRFNGTSGSWIRVNTAGGQFNGTTAIDGVSSMIVHNGQLYIGTAKQNAAEVYRYNGGSAWTQVSGSVAGTIGSGQASTDAVTSLISFGGRLYAGTREPNAADILVYVGGATSNTWTRVITTVGTVCTDAARDEVTSMVSANGSLFAAVRKGTTSTVSAASLCRYAGSETVWTRLNATAGTLPVLGTDPTNVASISSMVPYNGKVHMGIRKTNSADIFRMDDTTFTTFTGTRMNSAVGTITLNGTASIDGVTAMTVYNGKLIAATEEWAGSGDAEIYMWEGTADRWTKISNVTAGTIASGGTPNIPTVNLLIPWNGKLYAMTTNWGGSAEIYEYSYNTDQSYALKFHGSNSDVAGGEQAGFPIEGSIFFSASASASVNPGLNNHGAFIFSHSIMSSGGGYDVAEDYPTRDDSLNPGDVVSTDSFERGLVAKSKKAYDDTAIGVYSENPALRLSQTDSFIDGLPVVPVALAGRVPVKVTTENGPILQGDTLTTSSIPGVAMKATKLGAVIGQAMEPYEGEGIGKITAYINKSSYSGSVRTAFRDGLQIDDHITGSQILSALLAQEDTLNATQSAYSEVYTDRVSAGLEIITPKVITKDILVDHLQAFSGQDVTLQLGKDKKFVISDENGLTTISFDSQGNASFAGTLTANKIRANQIEGLEFIASGIKSQELRIASLSALFAQTTTVVSQKSTQTIVTSTVGSSAAQLSPSEVLAASISAQLEELSTTPTFSMHNFTTGGVATVAGDLRVEGNGLIEGILHVVDTLMTRDLLVSGIATFMQDSVFKGNINFEGQAVFNHDAAGQATIKKGNRFVDISFDKDYEETPVIQASLTSTELTDDAYKVRISNGACEKEKGKDSCQEKTDQEILASNTQFIVTKKSKHSFTIYLFKDAEYDVAFTWTATAIKDARMIESKPTPSAEGR